MTENQKIEKVDFNTTPPRNEYAKCQFVGCDFSKMQITDVYFEDCQFVGCNFSLTKFCNVLRDVKFVECKMMGADFSEVSKFALSFGFEKCNLSYASFVEVKMKNTKFVGCDLSDAYFDNANLEAAVFDDCDLERTSFFWTNLKKANFATARNFAINPTTCELRKAVFAQSDLRGLLAHLDIKITEF